MPSINIDIVVQKSEATNRVHVIDDSLNVEDQVKEKEKLTIEVFEDKQGEIATDRNNIGDEGLEMIEFGHNSFGDSNNIPGRPQIISISEFEPEECSNYYEESEKKAAFTSHSNLIESKCKSNKPKFNIMFM